MQELNRYLKDVHTTSKTDNPSIDIIGKTILTTLTVWMGYILIFRNPPWIFLDNVNLVIHEAGHFIFSGFGEMIQYMGGTIMQLLVPFMFAVYFVIKRNLFAFSFALFWTGNNLVNIAVYIKDAQSRLLPLVGGDHDWFYILTHLKILEHSEGLGNVVNTFGTLIALSGILLMILNILTSLKLAKQ